MSNKFVLYFAAAVIILGAGYYLVSQNEKNNTRPADNAPLSNLDDTQKAENTVLYSDTGFSPQSISIKNGDTVKFKNISTQRMWVASAPHPSHTDYPEFDAKRGLEPGETFSFTFNRAGSWKFHNHTNPQNSGVIVVE